jgi:plasmid stability protein
MGILDTDSAARTCFPLESNLGLFCCLQRPRQTVKALLALVACIAYNICMQYTIRNVPDHLDAALRRKAREQGKSLNDVAIEALVQGAGVGEQRRRQRDLGDIARTWRKDPAFEDAQATQDTIDPDLWR